jgi:hypothetical protein
MSSSFYRPGQRDYQNNPSDSERVEKKSSSGGGTVFLVIAIIVVILLAILTLILVIIRARRNATATTTVSDSMSSSSCSAPIVPQNVTVTYNLQAKTASIIWSPVSGATSYNVYRKIEDPSVSKTNYDSRINTIQLFENYIDLPNGTHYFVVTSKNSCGQESLASAPAQLAPICGNILVEPAQPSITEIFEDCGGALPYNTTEIDFAWGAFPSGSYVAQGIGQQGNVTNYFASIDRNIGPTGLIEVDMSCSINNVHTLTHIAVTDVATVSTPLQNDIGTSLQVSWIPIAGAEQYIVHVLAENASGIRHNYGSFASGNATSISLPTNSGDDVLDIQVRSFRLCDKSPSTVYAPP